jgi:hypothetical protein
MMEGWVESWRLEERPSTGSGLEVGGKAQGRNGGILGKEQRFLALVQ